MDFELSEEQALLKSSVDKLMEDRYGFDARKAIAASPAGYSPAIWAAFAEMGLLGLPFSEDDGGFGAGPVETMLVCQAFGKALCLEPYLATVVLAGGVLRHAGSQAQREAHIPAIVAGEARYALALTERHSRYDLFDVSLAATREGAGYRLSGQKSVVLHGALADHLIVSARTAGSRRDPAGVSLFLVDGQARGVHRRAAPGQDGVQVAEVDFDAVTVEEAALIGPPGGALPVIERVVEEAIAALSAEAVGIMDDLVAATVDYLKMRKQFGVPIGSFQSLQHRASEMFVALEQARSMMLLAAMSVSLEDAAERARLISAVKVQICKSARFIGQNAIQLHGGIGMTMEYKAGHSFKRLAMIEALFGDADHHLARVTEAGGLSAA